VTKKNDGIGVGELARSKLIQAALDLFGRRGLDGVSIRQISDRAGMNVASISYHFGSKDNLYSAVADYINEQISLHAKVPVEAATKFISSHDRDASNAMEHILSIVGITIDLMIPDSEETEQWARFITRFQLGEHIPDHELSRNPLHDLLAVLVAIVRKQPNSNLENAIIAQTIFGQMLVFRVNRLSAKNLLGITAYGPAEVSQIKQIVFSNIQKTLS